MKSTVKATKACPNCGGLLPSGALAGLCPACLLAQGADTDHGVGHTEKRFQPPSLGEIQKLFPQLEILSALGAGGMGAVYKARQPVLDRVIALKVLPAASVGGAKFEERFNREARALARLNHPNIVGVYEFGQAGGLHFFIMEFVDGANLRQLERAGRLSPREALQIIPQICEALQYAHDEGVVHRDIKPENVLVDRKGRVKIADFGLAKILGYNPESSRLTVEGQVMGTPHYMAPEQLERPLAVDHRADIYSLGVVFYEMLTGDLPLGKFLPPSSKVMVDVRLDEVVLRALENDPARRYQRVSEVQTEVETITSTPEQNVNGEGRERFVQWVGHPLVVERSGQRAVYWHGTLRAGALALLFLSFGCGLAYQLTNSQYPGWVSLVVRIFIVALITAWAVRRALKSTKPAQVLARTPKGKIKFPRLRPAYFFSFFALGGFLAVLIGSAFAGYLVSPRWPLWPKTAAITPEQIATRDGVSGTLVARLPMRGKVELLAVSDANAAPNAWWLPNGSPIADSLYELLSPGESNQTGYTNKNILFQWSDLPDGASGPMVEFEAGTGGGSGGEALRDGTVLKGAWPVRGMFPLSSRKTTLRVGFGLDQWETAFTVDLNRNVTPAKALPKLRNLRPQVHQILENAGTAQVTMVLGEQDRNWDIIRLVAVDTNGMEHAYARGSGTPADSKSIWTYEFRGLPLAKVKEFRVQARPIHWLKFPDVALEPRDRAAVGRSTRKFVPTRLSAPEEAHITELFDFETGMPGEFPSDQNKSKKLNGIERNPAWMLSHGYDVDAGTNELKLLQMEIVDLKQDEWEQLTPKELSERLRRQMYGPSRLPSTGGAALPVQYGFRTRDNTIGMLQLVAFDKAKAGVTVRYRLIERAHYE
jgi:predicted Ser/Thr protein kinase